MAFKYSKIEICPNRKCRLLRPNIILYSCKIFINGKWYNPASGV